MKKIKKIVIATGGTGGHVYPALSLSDFLERRFQVEIFSDKGGLRYFKNDKNIRIVSSGTIFQKNIFKSGLSIIKIIFSIIYSYFYLKKNKPNLVFGMGGYSSFPVCIASFLLKIPIIIYENNLVLGKANRVLMPLAKKILVSTDNIEGIKKKYKHKVLKSGYLLREEIFDLQKNQNFKKENKEISILIFGGSQSAKIFGEVIPKIITECYRHNIRIKIYQQCLENQTKKIEQIYQKNQISFNLFSFSEKLTDYYKVCDLAITRSGASSTAELINLKIPFIAIPLPSSADNHQLKNAIYFEKKGYCLLLEEKFITSKLFEILKDLNKNREKLLLLKHRMKNHSDVDSLKNVGNFIGKFLNEKN